MLASNQTVNVFHRGLQACDRHGNRESAIQQISCPVLFLLGAQEPMTAPKAAQGLIAQAPASAHPVQVLDLPVGHHQMTEAPDATLVAIRDFLRG